MMTRTKTSKSRRFNGLALALALSAGTAGGLFTVSAMTEPAAAQAVAGAGIPATTLPAQAEPAVAASPAAQPQRPAPRVVRINGFANCAVVKQVKTAPGREPDYRCDRAM